HVRWCGRVGTRRPPGSPPFPYTTLFRSEVGDAGITSRIAGDDGLDVGPGDGRAAGAAEVVVHRRARNDDEGDEDRRDGDDRRRADRKSTRLNSSHVKISYAVFCLKKKNK